MAALVREASRQNLPIRVAGSGHSFTPVVSTSGLLLSLENMQGLVSADLDRKRVVVRAGTRIGDIGRALKQIGLSLANQGDIDTQAIAGALSTGTHGTGITLGCLSSQAVGMRLIQSDGSVSELDADRDPETMAAAQVSIGMLGVMSTVTLQAISAYNLKETLWRDDFEACMERHDELAENNRHFSFFWCPVRNPGISTACPMLLLSRGQARARRLRDEGDERHRRTALIRTRRRSSASPTVRKSIRSNTSRTSTSSNMRYPSKTARKRCGKSAS